MNRSVTVDRQIVWPEMPSATTPSTPWAQAVNANTGIYTIQTVTSAISTTESRTSTQLRVTPVARKRRSVLDMNVSAFHSPVIDWCRKVYLPRVLQ